MQISEIRVCFFEILIRGFVQVHTQRCQKRESDIISFNPEKSYMHQRRTTTTSGGRGISEHLAPVDSLLKFSIPVLEVMNLTSID